MPKPIHRAEYEVLRRLLRDLRVQAGVKQSELSEALGQVQPYLSAIETGHRRIDIIEVRDICQVLGITLPDFVSLFERELRSPNKRRPAKRTRVE